MAKRRLDYTNSKGEPVPGVTSIIKLDMSEVIMGWCYRLTKEGRNPYAERNQSKEYGSAVHDLIFARLNGQSIAGDSPYVHIIDNFSKFTKGWKWLGGEFKVLNEGVYKFGKHSYDFRDCNYAGTIDQLFEIDGIVTLVDMKTSKDVYPKDGLQLAAYKMGFPDLDKQYQEAFSKVEKCLILHLDKQSGTWDAVDRTPTEIDYATVLHLRKVYDWRKLRGDLGR